MHVTVAIPTMKRPADLANLLNALLIQEVMDDLTYEILIVDNDAEGSARSVAEAFRKEGSMNVTYVVEPVRGISAARNRALSLACGDAIAFIDDDEVPCPAWLHHLTKTMVAGRFDIVFGPIVPTYPLGVSGWIMTSGVFERRRLASGAVIGLQDARTGNVLLSRNWLVQQVPPVKFDLRLGLTGGEDSLFFSKAICAGARTVWCDEAEVSERVPIERATAAYLVRRWYQIGISTSLIAKILLGRRGVLYEVIKGAVLLPWGLLVGTTLLPFSRRQAAKWYMKAVCGAGKIAGAFGHKIQLYASEAARR